MLCNLNRTKIKTHAKISTISSECLVKIGRITIYEMFSFTFVCFISDLSLHSADMSGKSIFLLFSLSVLISSGASLGGGSGGFGFSGSGGGGGGGGRRRNLGGCCWGGSNEFSMLSSDRVRMKRNGRLGGKGGGGGSRLPVDEILGAAP